MMLYLDNNATTMMPAGVKKEWLAWSNMGNPSSGYAAADDCRSLMKEFRATITSACACAEYDIIWTSGASESNCTFIRMVCDALTDRGVTPHIIASAYEHKSIVLCLEQLADRGVITVAWCMPERSGEITCDALEIMCRARKPNIVLVMQAQNELGVINDVEGLAEVAHRYGAVFHADTVQLMGKVPLRPQNVDSFVITFHKIHGPAGVGAWIVRKKLVTGYGLGAMICGTQNGGMRGGTENLAGLAAAFAGWRHTMYGRAEKNINSARMRQLTIAEMRSRYECIDYEDWREDRKISSPCAIVLFCTRVRYMPGCVFIAVILRDRMACNTELKKSLDRVGIVVSVGSACNTSSAKASHVIDAMGGCKRIKAGALRISYGDESTHGDVMRFMSAFENAIDENIARV